MTKNNGALTIDKAQLTLAAVADSRQYDGTNASGQAVVVTGLQGSDAVTASQSFDSKNVGNRTLAVNSGFTIADQNGGNNYTVSTQTASGTISQNTSANVVLTANSATVTYNGGNQTVSGVVATGLLGDDVVNNGGASASVSGRNAGTYTNALSDTAQIEANYANVTKNNGVLLIDRRSLGVVGTAVADKPFDGQVSAVISRLGVLQGLVEGEDLGHIGTGGVFGCATWSCETRDGELCGGQRREWPSLQLPAVTQPCAGSSVHRAPRVQHGHARHACFGHHGAAARVCDGCRRQRTRPRVGSRSDRAAGLPPNRQWHRGQPYRSRGVYWATLSVPVLERRLVYSSKRIKLPRHEPIHQDRCCV